MAIHRLLMVLSMVVAFSAISATARPCKTIFFIASSSVPIDQSENPQFTTLSFTRIRLFNPNPTTFITYRDSLLFPSRRALNPPQLLTQSSSPLRERTLDFITVVGALLFGVGCGALFGGTLYLIWFCISPSTFSFGCHDADDFDDLSLKKKGGYAAIPAVVANEKIVAAAAPVTVKQVD